MTNNLYKMTNSYTSDCGSLKIEINTSTWVAKAIDLDNNNDTYTLDMSTDDAEELDGMVGNMRSRFSTIRRHAGQIKELSMAGQEMRERKKQFFHSVSELKKEISTFKV